MRGYEDCREQYSQIITAAQWRFHHQRWSQPQITTFISHYPAPTRWRTSPRWPSCHMSHMCVSLLHADAASPASLCKAVNLFYFFLLKKKKTTTGRCFDWGRSALLEMWLDISLPHLNQSFREEETCGGGLLALKSACLTNCGSSVELVAQRAAATSAVGGCAWKTEDARRGKSQTKRGFASKRGNTVECRSPSASFIYRYTVGYI